MTYKLMTRFVLISVLISCLSLCRLSAQEYSVGDIFERDGISYKVLVSFLVIDSKETTDTIYGPEQFHGSGEVMVTNVSRSLNDVVIPPAVDKYKVVGLTDSLFYEHEHERIWLPDLLFAGNCCFAKLKIGTGTLVVHNIMRLGALAFDDMEGNLVFDITNGITWNDTFTESAPKGEVRLNSRNLGMFRGCPIYQTSISASGKNFTKWVDEAFKNDAEFQKNEKVDKNARFTKKMYSTMPMAKKDKGFDITARAVDVKKLGIPWGNLTNEYYRVAQYTVLDKKKKKTSNYSEFIPVADATLKEGWYAKFVGENGVEKYRLNGKKIKK